MIRVEFQRKKPTGVKVRKPILVGGSNGKIRGRGPSTGIKGKYNDDRSYSAYIKPEEKQVVGTVSISSAAFDTFAMEPKAAKVVTNSRPASRSMTIWPTTQSSDSFTRQQIAMHTRRLDPTICKYRYNKYNLSSLYFPFTYHQI
jgi:hypothetical protein